MLAAELLWLSCCQTLPDTKWPSPFLPIAQMLLLRCLQVQFSHEAAQNWDRHVRALALATLETEPPSTTVGLEYRQLVWLTTSTSCFSAPLIFCSCRRGGSGRTPGGGGSGSGTPALVPPRGVVRRAPSIASDVVADLLLQACQGAHRVQVLWSLYQHHRPDIRPEALDEAC